MTRPFRIAAIVTAHFFAHAIKGEIIDWLDPKPITYRADDQARIGFQEAYLPES